MPWSEGGTYEQPSDWWRLRGKALKRDGYRCTARLPSGKRCPRTEELEVNHIVQPLAGGTHDLDNLETLCREHHRRITAEQAQRGRMRWKHKHTPETHPGIGGTT